MSFRISARTFKGTGIGLSCRIHTLNTSLPILSFNFHQQLGNADYLQNVLYIPSKVPIQTWVE